MFDEVENVRPLYGALVAALRPVERSYEILFVDDGSRDGTLAELRTVQAQDDAVRILHFKRNFGQTPATRAGIQASRGDVVVTLDADLQNDPADIPILLAEIERGHDLVVGWRRDRQDSKLLRTLPSRAANWLIAKITGVRVRDSGCSLRAYRREMIQRVPLYSEMHRFIPAISRLRAARTTEVVVRHHPRERGESKYGLSRVGKVLLDVVAIKMLISFGRRPSHWFFALAVPFFAAGITVGVAHGVWRLGGGAPDILVSPAVSMLCGYIGVHFSLVGLLAELVIRSPENRRNLHNHIKVNHVVPAA